MNGDVKYPWLTLTATFLQYHEKNGSDIFEQISWTMLWGKFLFCDEIKALDDVPMLPRLNFCVANK